MNENAILRMDALINGFAPNGMASLMLASKVQKHGGAPSRRGNFLGVSIV